jgi:8-oxo-dGTP pyrophosphatase MutT (NUDIX family)
MKLAPSGPEQVAFRGRVFEIVNRPMSGNGKTILFENARRSPGVRLIVTHKDKLLLIKEFRYELNAEDFRLPGGKVFDTLPEYLAATDIPSAVQGAAERECVEETGVRIAAPKLFHVSHAGAMVTWDLYYFVAELASEEVPTFGLGENITVLWKTFEEAKELCITGQISEDRTVGVLLRFLLSHKTA